MADAAKVQTQENSMRAQKGQITRAIAALKTLCDAVRTSDVKTQMTLDQLEKSLTALNDVFGKYETKNLNLQNYNPDKSDAYSNQLDYESDRLNEWRIEALQCMKLCGAASAKQNANAGTVPNYKIVDSMKPEKISKACSPLEMEHWKKQFKAFFTSSHLELRPLHEQQQHFCSAIDSNLLAIMETRIRDNTNIFTNDEDEVTCFKIMEEEFLTMYPLDTRRLEFLSLKQRERESFSDYLARGQKLKDLAAMPTFKDDDLFKLVLVSGMMDQDLQQDCMELPTGGNLLADIITKGKGRDSTNAIKKKIEEQVPSKKSWTRATEAKTQSQNNGKKSSKAGKKVPDKKKKLQEEGLCYRCGDHKTDQPCKLDKDHECENCGKKGHVEKTCFGAPNKPSEDKQPNEKKVNYVNKVTAVCNRTFGIVPEVILFINYEKGMENQVPIVCEVDTGSSTTFFSQDLVMGNPMLKKNFVQKRDILALNATDKVMQVTGYLQIKAYMPNGMRYKIIYGLVSEEIKGQTVLLSWKDAFDLGVVKFNETVMIPEGTQDFFYLQEDDAIMQALSAANTLEGEEFQIQTSKVNEDKD